MLCVKTFLFIFLQLDLFIYNDMSLHNKVI
jgi:hypothetical protein